MTAPTDSPLAGKRILVPPARPEVNPLFRMLEREGAEVLEFPALRVALPTDYGPMDRAIRQLKSFEWTIFSGSNCVVNFFDRLNNLGLAKAAIMATDELGIDLRVRLKGVTIAAVGPATAEAARSHGLTPDIVSKGHIADLAESLTDFF